MSFITYNIWYIYTYYTQNAVLDTKAAAPLATAGISALCPLLVKSSIEVLGKNAEKTPMDFVAIRRLLTKTCQARSQCTCVTSTKVQKYKYWREDLSGACSIYLRYWHKRTHTDAKTWQARAAAAGSAGGHAAGGHYKSAQVSRIYSMHILYAWCKSAQVSCC
jgi:hypothetical protein